MPDFTIDPTTSALVLIDLQRGIVGMETAPLPASAVVAAATELASAFRARGALVVLVRVDPGPGGVLFPRPPADIPRPPFDVPPEWSTIVPELGPEPGDVVVTKHHPGAFHGTDLDLQLRRRGIRTIVLGGISTNIGVEATARAAFEHGYAQVFLSDAMAARGADLHEWTVTRVFPTLGRVRTARQVLDAMG
jgi:nicotinamidase-related amidase